MKRIIALLTFNHHPLVTVIYGLLGVLFIYVGLTRSVTAESCTDIAQLTLVDERGWLEGVSIPTPRSEVKAAALGGQMYVAGGLLSRFEPSDAFYRYDVEAETWHEAASLPVALHHVGLAALDGKVYLAGGYSAESNWNVEVVGAWVYDAESDSWSSMADLPTPRAGHEMVSLDGKLYVVGGLGPEPTPLLVYHPQADAWETLAEMPQPSDHLAAAVLDGKIYAIGGRWSEGNMHTVQIYEPETDTWTRAADLPTARSGFTAGVVNGRIHTVGGEALTSSCTYSQHEVYDPAADTWERWTDLPTSRHGLASAVVEDRWYVMGGATGAGGQTGGTLTDAVSILALEATR
jgi:N-acetylneuraminic acid mutarotase